MEKYITITGVQMYYGAEPFQVGRLLRCKKEVIRGRDRIRAILPLFGTVGFVAERRRELMGGTVSSERIYDLVPEIFYARILFTSRTRVICKVEPGPRQAFEQEFADGLNAEEPSADVPSVKSEWNELYAVSGQREGRRLWF